MNFHTRRALLSCSLPALILLVLFLPTHAILAQSQTPLAQAPSELPASVQSCQQLVVNGGFELDAAWVFPVTPATGAYSTAAAHMGARSARLGLLPGAALTHPEIAQLPQRNLLGEVAPLGAAYSTTYQRFTIPASGFVTLAYWYKPGTQATSGDWQRVMLLNTSYGLIKDLTGQELNGSDTWQYRTFDLTPYRGRTVILYFEVYNNSTGSTGRTWMYVDDVSVEACTTTPTPTPTSTNTPTATPTNTPTNTPTPTETPTPTATPTPTNTPTPTDTPTPTPTDTPTLTPSPTDTPTITPTPSNTPTPTDTPTPTYTPTITPTPTAIHAHLALDPASHVLPLGECVPMTVTLNTAGGPVDAVDLNITFEPAYLQVVADDCQTSATTIDPGDALALTLRNQVDPGAGTILFSAGRSPTDPRPSGTFAVASFLLKGMNATPPGGSPLAFAAGTGVYVSGIPATLTTTGATISVTVSTLLGQVDLQGRGAPPAPTWAGYPLTITLETTGSGTLTAAALTDPSGVFTVTTLPSLLYPTVCVKGAHALSVYRTDVDLTAGPPATPIPFGVLREGDTNGDDRVQGADFSLLAAAYGACSGDAAFDARADFDGNGCVDGTDFSLLVTNYWAEGTCPLTATALAIASNRVADGPVTLALEPARDRISPDEVVAVTARMYAGEQPIDNVDLEILFDPAQIEVTALEMGSALPQVWSNTVDQQAGRILAAAGRDFAGSAPSGEFDLATLRVRARPGITGPIQLIPGTRTGAYFDGEPVLAQAVGAELSASDSPPAPRVWLPLIRR